MTDTIRNWWSGLSLREHWLVGVAAGLSAILIGWFLIYAPLRSALASASEEHGEAVDREAAIAMRVAAIKQLEVGGGRPAAAASAAAVSLVLAQSAAEQGFTLSRNDPAGDNATTIAISNARASALAAWLTRLEDTGLSATDLSIRPNADGTVAVTASIRRAP